MSKMDIDLKKLTGNLWCAKAEKTVPDDQVNPYLLNVLLRRLQSGEDVTYGEVDFSRFAADDLRTLDGYLKQHENMGFRLSRLIGNVDNAAPYCCALSAFC